MLPVSLVYPEMLPVTLQMIFVSSVSPEMLPLSSVYTAMVYVSTENTEVPISWEMLLDILLSPKRPIVGLEVLPLRAFSQRCFLLASKCFLFAQLCFLVAHSPVVKVNIKHYMSPAKVPCITPRTVCSLYALQRECFVSTKLQGL